MHASTVIPQNSWQVQNKTMFSWRFIFQALYKQQKLNQNKVSFFSSFYLPSTEQTTKIQQKQDKLFFSVIFHF